jgi:hypothetical protein
LTVDLPPAVEFRKTRADFGKKIWDREKYTIGLRGQEFVR